MHGQERWGFLFFTSAVFFFAEFVLGQISVLDGRLQGTAEACHNGTDLDCLNLNAAQFNSLFVAHFWAGGASAMFTGFFVGRFGIWIASWVSATILLIGMILITTAPYCSTDDAAYGLLLAGRIIFAVGYYGNVTLSHEVKSHWFLGKELALAFTIYISSCRLGSVTTYAAVGAIVEKVGLQNTLWCMFAVGTLCPLSALVAGWIYKRHVRLPPSVDVVPEPTRQFSFSKIRKLGLDFWIMIGIIFLYFADLFTFLSDGPKFLKDVYDYSESLAGIIIGAIPDVALLAPLLGAIIDRYGGRDIFTVVSLTLYLVAFLLLAFVPVFLIGLTCILIGLSNSIMTASIWSSIPLVTSPAVVGVAMGVALGVQAFGGGLLLLVTGFILNDSSVGMETRWARFFELTVTFAIVAWVLSGLLMYSDGKHGGKRLRLRHTLPTVTVMKKAEADECTPLVGANTMSSGKSGIILISE